MKLNLPPFTPKIQKNDGKAFIFDVVRKKYISLTPEEWVRQHIIHFLINQQGYPRSLIRVEGGLEYNRLDKRTDVVVYDKKGVPLIVVECKSFKVALSDDVFQQSAIYNSTLKAPYLLITNGMDHYCCHVDYQHSSYVFLDEIPSYSEVKLE